VFLLSKWLSSFDGRILGEILRGLTRYSANEPQFPVNDGPLLTGTRPMQNRRREARLRAGKINAVFLWT
jgi:hypothetical protein